MPVSEALLTIDAAPGRLHDRCRGADAVERAGEVHVDQQVPTPCPCRTSSGLVIPMPALLTRSVSPPIASAASRTAASSSRSPSRTSTATASAADLRGHGARGRLVAVEHGHRRAVGGEAAGRSRRRCPRPPPVTRTERPSNRPAHAVRSRVVGSIITTGSVGEHDGDVLRDRKLRLVVAHQLAGRAGEHGDEVVPGGELLHGDAVVARRSPSVRRRAARSRVVHRARSGVSRISGPWWLCQ